MPKQPTFFKNNSWINYKTAYISLLFLLSFFSIYAWAKSCNSCMTIPNVDCDITSSSLTFSPRKNANPLPTDAARWINNVYNFFANNYLHLRCFSKTPGQLPTVTLTGQCIDIFRENSGKIGECLSRKIEL